MIMHLIGVVLEISRLGIEHCGIDDWSLRQAFHARDCLA
jgi:hypothetical protein